MSAKLDAKTLRVAKAVGQRLRELRLEADVSQERLAEKVGMTRGNYARVEAGLTNVTIDTMLRIAAGLGAEMVISFEPRGSGRSPRTR